MAIKIITVGPDFADERGVIKAVLDNAKHSIKSVLYIKSKKGTIRGKHFHKKDCHYVYCLSGSFVYTESVSPNSKREQITLYPGDLVFTKPNHWHSMEYLEDSEMLAMATEPRIQHKYEKDTFRSD